MKCRKQISVKGVMHNCGRCLACRLNYARDWAIRLYCEVQEVGFKDCCFVTLTYDDDHYPPNGSISVRELQLFLKRLRKIGSFRYFASAEYGEKTNRPHYHLAIIGQGIFSKLFSNHRYFPSKKGYDVKCDAWNKGKIFVGTLTEDSANYVAGYMLKKVKGREAYSAYKERGLVPPFSLKSLKPGLGHNWCLKNAKWLKESCGILYKGRPVPLPRYFIKLLFSDEEIAEAIDKRYFEAFEKWSKTFNYNIAHPVDLSHCDKEHADQYYLNVLSKNPFNRERF